MKNVLTANILNVSYRSRRATEKIGEYFSSIFTGGLSPKKIAAAFLAIFELLGVIMFDLPATPRGQEVNLDSYELVFFDDFNGDTLDENVWYHRHEGVRRAGYVADSQVSVRDGNMVITGEYLEDGKYGAGWYGGMVSLINQYTRGYFEIRCICSSGDDFWSAFWLKSDGEDNPALSRGGIGGAEIDIFEANNFGSTLGKDGVSQTVHCRGSVDGSITEQSSLFLGKYYGNNIYNEYNTYSLEWTETEYIFYINGIETARTSFLDGVSEVPEDVIISLELPGEITLDKGSSCEFLIDYVKVYQIP